jgi:hypothetical protein
MNTVSAQNTISREATVIRLGGLAGLSIIGLYVLITFVLTRFPGPSSVPFGELKTYILDHADAMAVGNGLRYLVLICIAFFAVGMYTFTGRGATLTGNEWGILGLLGAAALMANGAVSNAVLTFAYLSFAKLSEQPEHFMLQSNLSRVLFTVGQLFWGLMIGSFSIAAWQSATVPKWMIIPGLLFAALAVFNVVFIAWIIAGGRGPELLQLVQIVVGLFWMPGVSLLMILRANKIRIE